MSDLHMLRRRLAELDEFLDRIDPPVEVLDLDGRTLSALRGAGIPSLSRLLWRTRWNVLGLPRFGEDTVRKIEAALAKRGLALSDSPGQPAYDDYPDSEYV